MKKIICLLLSVVLAFGMLFSLASCNKAPADPGAEISIYLGADVFDLDPTDYYVDSNAEQVMTLLFEPLFSINGKGKRVNAMAEDYEVDIVERKIEIFLRESYWSDGTKVQAADFLYAWREVLLEPNKPNPAAALLYDIENAVAIKSGDLSPSALAVVASAEKNSLTITYREGADYERLLDNLASVATSPLRQSAVGNAGSYWSKDITTIVTNGPFNVKEINYYAGGAFTLERNIGYHQPVTEVKYDQHVTPNKLVSFISMDEPVELTYADIESKAVFYMGDATLADRSANKDKATVSDDLSVYTYVFNTNKAPFDNALVRRALSLALDREAMAEAAIFGKAANGFLSDAVAKSIYGDSIKSRLSGNMAEAVELIAEADLSSADMKFTLTVNDDEESIAIAELAVAAWEVLGFDVKIDAVGHVKSEILDTTINEKKEIYDSEIQALIKDASYGITEFDVIAVDWQYYSKDAFVSLASLTSNINGNGMNMDYTSRANVAGWCNSDYDSYVKAAFNARSEEQRAEYLKEAEKILLEEAPIIPVIFNQNFAFISSELSDITVDGLGNFVFTKAELDNYHDYLPKDEESGEEESAE